MATIPKPPTPRNCYSPRTSVVSPPGQTPAQQQFKDDCDINKIMQRFQKTGAIDHVAKHQPQYGFVTPLSYHESLNIISTADSMFNDLPSSIRNQFHNNPQAFLEFVQNPDNADQLRTMGLALSPAAQLAAEEQDVPNTGAVVPPGGEGSPPVEPN